LSKGESDVDYDDILRNVKERDFIDQNREVSPLRKADDAILLDNGNLTHDEQNAWLMKCFNDTINGL
jgi:cytidylate kinase